MEKTQTLRALIYIDDERVTDGEIEIRKVTISPDDPSFDPDEPSASSGFLAIVNGRPARPVGPAVIDLKRGTLIWRFKRTPTEEPVADHPVRSSRILLVEDDEMVSNVLQHILKRTSPWKSSTTVPTPCRHLHGGGSMWL